MTDKESFVNVDGWLKEIEKHCGTDVSVIVLANKADVGQKTEKQNIVDTNGEYNDEDDDQEREIEVTDEDIAAFEQTHNLKVLKTSAKSGSGVDEAFLEMTKALIKKQNSMSAEDRKKLNPGNKLGGLKGANFNKRDDGKGSGCC